MSNRIKGVCRIVPVVTAAVCWVSVAYAAETIDATNVNELSEAAELTVKNFELQSFKLRMRYECHGTFTPHDDRIKLRELAATAIHELRATEKKQAELKTQIEQYDGTDWDTKFGKNGLWRKLAGDIYITALSRVTMQFYQALCEERLYQADMLNAILNETKSSTAAFLRPKCILLRARIMRELEKQKYWQETAAELKRLLIESDIPESVYFLAAVENVKLSGENNMEFLNSLAIKLENSNCRDNAEVVLPLAFLLRKYASLDCIKKTIYENAAAGDFLGSVILEELHDSVHSGELALDKLEQTEAELAAYTAWKDGPEEYVDLLTRLSEVEKFQSALINYVAGIALAETKPDEAVRLLIKSSRLQNTNKSLLREMDALQIANEAVRIAYTNFTSQKLDSKVTLGAFENYFEIAGSRADEQLQYLYTVVLGNCGQSQKAKEQLERIAFCPGGTFAARAKLDLIVLELQQGKTANSTLRSEIMRQLKDLFVAADADTSERAKILYCQLLIDHSDGNWAKEVLETLTSLGKDKPMVEFMRSKALQQMDRFNESVVCMLPAIQADPCQYQADAEELLAAIVEEIDRLESEDTNFASSVENYVSLAKFCRDGSKDADSQLRLIEIEILAAAKMPEKLAGAARLLDVLAANGEQQKDDSLRCRARVLIASGDFNAAGKLWAEIAAAEKTRTLVSDEPSLQWWRAKYYEIYCLSKLPQTKKADLLHTINVLKHSHRQCPLFWIQKFDSLEKEIGSK